MSQFTVSKALAKSINMPSVVSLFSMESVNLYIRCKSASMVENYFFEAILTCGKDIMLI